MRRYPTGGAPGRPSFGLVYVYRRRGLLGKNTLCPPVVVLLSLAAPGSPARPQDLLRGRVGRAWMAIRGMHVVGESIGIRPLRTKLLAP